MKKLTTEYERAVNSGLIGKDPSFRSICGLHSVSDNFILSTLRSSVERTIFQIKGDCFNPNTIETPQGMTKSWNVIGQPTYKPKAIPIDNR